MSKNETPMTRWYWNQVGGTLIEEFPAVQASATCGARLIDGVIVVGGEKRICSSYEIELKDRDIIVVQTKTGRLGMYLMGQALFSAQLMLRFQPRSILSVALCHQNDSILGPMFEAIPNMRVVICPKFSILENGSACPEQENGVES